MGFQYKIFVGFHEIIGGFKNTSLLKILQKYIAFKNFYIKQTTKIVLILIFDTLGKCFSSVTVNQ